MDSKNTGGSRPLRVAIIGGGIGGVLLAIGLQKHEHIDYQLYEAATSFGEIGLGVAIGPNAQHALELIDPRARAVLDKLGSTNLWESHLLDFVVYKSAHGPSAGQTICAQKTEAPIRTVHRARLLEGLVDLVADQSRCHFSKRLAAISQPDTRDPCTLHFADGSTSEADVVLGADGVHSSVRKYVLGDDHPALRPQNTGAVVYRGVVPMERVAARLGEEVAHNTYCHFGPDVLTLSYPIEQGKLANFVIIDVAHGGEVGEQWMRPAKVDEIRPKLREFSDAMQGVVELLDTPDLMAWAMFHHGPAPAYNKGCVAVMGDGAHSMTPFQGQGAGQAVEDALVLENLFGHVLDAAMVPRALAAYDQVRRPRKQRVAETSLEVGRMLTYLDPSIGDDLDKIHESLETRMHWIWNRDLTSQNEEVVRLFKESL